MASLVGNGFDATDNWNIDAAQSTLVRDFLDMIGLSENSLQIMTAHSYDSAVDPETIEPFILPDETMAATVLAPEGKQISLSLNSELTDERVLIVQGSGDALITGGSGVDNIQTGNGNDTVKAGSGGDFIHSGFGDDIIYGNIGGDTLSAGEGADSLFGGQGEDCISGGDDSDFLMGNKGADIVYGNIGDDILYGNQQNDVLYGGADGDTLYGGQNDDTLEGGRGDDVLHGNLGGDQFVFRANSGVDVIYDFVAGTDIIRVATGINGLPVAEPGDLASRISSDAQGNAVIDFGNGNVVTIDGLSAGDLLGDISAFITVG